jgi:hypothetical protein
MSRVNTNILVYTCWGLHASGDHPSPGICYGSMHGICLQLLLASGGFISPSKQDVMLKHEVTNPANISAGGNFQG